jgi:hypothetical protein
VRSLRESSRAQGHVRWMRGTGHAAGGGTARRRRGSTAASPLCHSLHAVRPDAGSALARRARLQADLCRPLGAVAPRPSARPDGVRRWPGGHEARGRQPRKHGRHRLPLLAGWPGPAPGGQALARLVGLTVGPSRRRYLGQPGEPGPPGGRALPAPPPDSARQVPHDLFPQRRGRVACVAALGGAVPGGWLSGGQGPGPQGGRPGGAPHPGAPWPGPSASASARPPWGC